MKPRYPFVILAITLCPGMAALAAPLTEREELTLPLNQLTQIEASLHRAQQSAKTDIHERYYFDYLRIHGDITTLRDGIEHYLTPTRVIWQRLLGNTGRRKPRHKRRILRTRLFF